MPTVPYLLKNGIRVPSVTTVISKSLGWSRDALIAWAWREGTAGRDYRQSRQDAADAGTLAHAMVEASIRHQPFAMPSDVSPDTARLATLSFSAFEEWFQASRIELVATEVHLVSEAHRFGGTPDAVGRVKGQLAMVDWKTGKAIYSEYLIQLAAYVELWNENHGDAPITGGIHCCRFSKETGGFSHHYWPVEALAPAWEAFLRLRDLYDLERQMKGLAA